MKRVEEMLLRKPLLEELYSVSGTSVIKVNI